MTQPLSKLRLAQRWGCDRSTIYEWQKRRADVLPILIRGAEYPLCKTLVTDFTTVWDDHGFQGNELARESGFALNTIKSWAQSEKRVARFWDLVRGYRDYVVSR